MSTLVRNDGSVFLVGVYREQLKKQKPKRLRSALRGLSNQHGRYVRVVEDALGNVDVALDKSAGFLLGETMAQHFKKGEDYIYVERLQKDGKVLVVVVEGGKVRLDAVLFPSEVWQELVPLMPSNGHYRLFHFGFDGSSPIEITVDEPTASSAKALLADSTAMAQSVFSSLPLDDSQQLLPCEKALQATSFSGVTKKNSLFAVIAVCFVLLVVAVIHAGRQGVHQQRAKTPYSDYYQGVADQPATQVADAVLTVVSQMASAPALNLHQIDYKQHKLQLNFMKKDEKLGPLLKWAKHNQFNFKLQAEGALLTRHQTFSAAKVGEKIYPAQEVYVHLSDQLRHILPGSSFRLLSTRRSSHWKSLACQWKVVGLSPTGLRLLQKLLADMPVSCNKMSLSYRDGLMQGTVRFVIWGS